VNNDLVICISRVIVNTDLKIAMTFSSPIEMEFFPVILMYYFVIKLNASDAFHNVLEHVMKLSRSVSEEIRKLYCESSQLL
jgi:hypothetical protein